MSITTWNQIIRDKYDKPVGPEAHAGMSDMSEQNGLEPAGPAPEAEVTVQMPPRAQPQPGPRLQDEDLRMLRQALLSGEDALARRSDLVELHKRFVQMFETLNTGLGDMHAARAQADRDALSARIDAMETAVNRMEGALRIELEPVLRQTFAESLAETQAVQTPHRKRSLWLVAALVAGLTLGTVFHTPLSAGSTAIVSRAETAITLILLKLSPNGGISEADSLVD